jgi:hypothetical protein
MTASALLFRHLRQSRERGLGAAIGRADRKRHGMQGDSLALDTVDRIEAATRTIQIKFDRGRKGIVGSGGLEPASVGSAHRIADGWDHDSSGEG